MKNSFNNYLATCHLLLYILGKETIVGGQTATRHAYPWQIRTNQGCGGTIICPNFVLTAWHCTGQTNPPVITPARDIRVLVGAHNVAGWVGGRHHEPWATVHTVLNVYRHPKGIIEDKKTYRYDFALLELSKPIRLWDGAQPVYLPVLNDLASLHPASKFAVSGWGLTQSALDECLAPWPRGPCVLRVVSLNYYSHNRCPLQTHGPDEICAAGAPPGDQSSCVGDSGGW